MYINNLYPYLRPKFSLERFSQMKDNTESTIWLVSLERGLNTRKPKYSKKQILTYTPGQQGVQFPIGVVIQHSNGGSSYEVFDSNFEIARDWVAYRVYDTSDISKLEGELLTIADASFTDKQQREAYKSLIRQTLWKFNANREREVTEIYKHAE